jgi:ech hydrogenase subunit F
MFRIILRNILKQPSTRLYPKVQREPFERSRGRLEIDHEKCIHCGICQRQCPADAITVNRQEGVWKLDAFRCIICGECVLKCPKKCLAINSHRREPGEIKLIVAYESKNKGEL